MARERHETIWLTGIGFALVVTLSGSTLMAAAAAAGKSGSSKQKSKTKALAKAPIPIQTAPVQTLSREEMILRGHPTFSYQAWLATAPALKLLDLQALFPADLATAPEVDRTALAKEWQVGAPRFELLRDSQGRQDVILRGDIDQPAVKAGLEAALKLSLLRLRLLTADQLMTWILTEGDVWQKALMTLTYDEASPNGLRSSVRLRFLLWNELRFKVKTLLQHKPSGFISEALSQSVTQWFSAIQPAWPIDRIYIAESRKVLAAAPQLVANGIANELQKNSLRSVSEIRAKLRGGQLPALAALDSLWTAEDVASKQQETDLLNEIILRLLVQRFEHSQGHPAASLEALVGAGLLPGVPLRLQSQKKWTLADL